MFAPLHPHENRRLALLQSLDIRPDAMPDAGLQALARCAAQISGLPLALVTLVDAQHQWCIAAAGQSTELPAPIDRRHGLCQYTILQNDTLVVPDTLVDPRSKDLPGAAALPPVRFYAAHPLLVEGLAVGSLSLIGFEPQQLDTPVRNTLAQLAGAATALLQSRRHLLDANRQRERLLDFARAAGDWMWETDAEHRYRWLSDAFEPLTGLQGDALIGQPISDAAPLDAHGQPRPDGLDFRTVLDRRMAFNRVISAMVTPRGRLHVSRSAVPVFDGQGRFAGYRGTARDVTATLAVAAAARGSEAMLRQLSAQVPGMLFILDQQRGTPGMYRFVSDGAMRELGIDADELMADARAFFERLPPDQLHGLMAAAERSAARRCLLEHSFRARGADGRLRWYETRAMPTPGPDGTTVWHGLTTDVSERMAIAETLRRHEERWQLAADAAAIGIAQFTLADGLIRLDDRACANHGLPARSDGMTLTEWLALIEPSDRDIAQRELQRTCRDGAQFEGRYRVRQPAGGLRWLEFVARATRDTAGRISGLIGTCRDVHDQQIAADLLRDKQDAERASRAKSSFLSRISHELRTPLNGILGFAQLMALDRDQPLNAVQAQRLASVQQAGQHLLALVNDVLELSRVETAEAATHHAPVDLTAAVRTCVANAQPLARSLDMTLRTSEAGSVCVRGDARAVEQILSSLLATVMQHAAAGDAIGVDLRVVTLDGEGPAVTVRVRSRGAEPAPNDTQPAARRPIDGDSLSLAIARHLALAMGGRVDALRDTPQGNALSLWLPLTDCPVVTVEPDATQRQTPRREVLYIEDEPLNQILLQEVFRARPHWQLHLASDASTGLRLARELGQRLALVLIDMNLPDATGLVLLGWLQADDATRALRCIALSADALREHIQAAHQAGFDAYWTKPIDVPQVLAALDSILAAPVDVQVPVDH